MPALFDPRTEAASQLRRWQAVFERDGNKAAAWRCYRLARTWEFPIPNSILDELDRIGSAFARTIDEARRWQADPSRDAAPLGLSNPVAGRIVMEAGRGSTDPAVGFLAWERDFEIASAVATLRASGLSEAEAVERASQGTVGLAWGVRGESDTLEFASVATPACSGESIRRAVRRVSKLLTD